MLWAVSQVDEEGRWDDGGCEDAGRRNRTSRKKRAGGCAAEIAGNADLLVMEGFISFRVDSKIFFCPLSCSVKC